MIGKDGYYHLTEILKIKASYYLVIGERSGGKTYSVKERVIDKYKYNPDEKFVYLRRRTNQIARKEMKQLFEDISDYSCNILGDYIHYTNDFGFYIENDAGERETLGWAMSIEDGITKKGIPWNRVTTIFFDEFLEYGYPIENEIKKFLNVVSTIVRKRDNVEIFMCANTVTRSSEYFDLFGIDVKKLKRGGIRFGSHKGGVTFAIEWTDSANIIDGIKQKSKYMGFDNNPTTNMILYGEWDYDCVNITDIDGIGWKAERMLIPFYLTAIGEVYELSIYESDNPILFVRRINTQNGEVRKEIRYNVTYDNSLNLLNKNGRVPCYGKVCSLMDKEVVGLYNISKKCIEAKRIVFDTMQTGSDFLKFYQYV